MYKIERDEEGYFDKREFYELAICHARFRNLLQANIKWIKKVDKLIENDLEEHFQTWVPLSNNV